MDRIDTFVNGLANDILETKSADPEKLKLEIKSLVEKRLWSFNVKESAVKTA